jgi:hypothetical protein
MSPVAAAADKQLMWHAEIADVGKAERQRRREEGESRTV